MPPSASCACCTKSAAPSSVLTSATSGIAPGMSAAAASIRSCVRLQIATVTPSCASASAVALPNPADDAATDRSLPCDSEIHDAFLPE